MNHSLFISFNWEKKKKREGEKETVLCRWDVWSPLFFFYYVQMKKKIQRSLSLYPPTSRSALGEPDWERNLIRSGQKSERDTLHHCEVPRFSEMPPLLSLLLSPVSSTHSLFTQLSLSSSSPPQPLIFTILPSTPAPSSPDTRHSAASQVSPFSSTASLLWWCCSAIVLTAHSFPCFPRSDLCSALQGLKEMDPSLACSLSAVCVSGRVCG